MYHALKYVFSQEKKHFIEDITLKGKHRFLQSFLGKQDLIIKEKLFSRSFEHFTSNPSTLFQLLHEPLLTHRPLCVKKKKTIIRRQKGRTLGNNLNSRLGIFTFTTNKAPS